MDMSDVHSIQFLDLSEVDEHERSRVLSSLQKIDPSVELPWIKKQKKIQYQDLPHKNEKSIHNAVPIQNNTHIYNNVPVAIVSHNQAYEHPPVVPVHYVYTQNVLPSNGQIYYNNSIPSPTYHSPIIPQNNVNNMYPISVKPAYHTNPVTFPASFNNVAQGETLTFNESIPIVQNTGPVYQNQIETVPPPQPIVEGPPFQNGVEVQNKPVENQAPAATTNKSWASLFNASKTASNQQVTENVAKPGFTQAVIPESNNNEVSCPFKNPKKAQYFDPDCYRMGEFLVDYTVDGRTISLQPRGLINQSNYCYINSILQALIACPPMYNLLSGLSQNLTSNEKRKPTPVIDGMCKFVKEFKHLPAGQRVGRRTDKTHKKEQGVSINCDMPFEASWIYRLLNGIRTDLIEGRQEDAEEFLGCLLNGLNDEMLELIKLVKNDKPEGANVQNEDSEVDKEWLVMGSKKKCSVTRRTDFDRTPISDIFGGFLKSRIHRAGDHDTENIQPFFTLQLNIETVNTVSEALEALVTKYQLEGVTSSKTNEEVEAWQQVMLDELPVILILHLKCFDFKLDGCKKIIKALEFPIDLKIDTKLLSSKTNSPNKKQYKLFAVVYHDGKEASKGHYITDAFHVGYNSWLRYDDASVKPVLEEHVLKPQGTRVPYLLFYRRSDTIRSK